MPAVTVTLSGTGGAGYKGVPVTVADAGPSAAPARVAITRTV